MARPQILQKLKHGRIMCARAFSKFVETWNYIVDRVDNIKGDQDVNPQTGFIRVDNTNHEHPVIRFDSSKLPEALSGDVLVDSQVANLQLSSIQYLSSDQGQVLDLYDFDKTSPTKSMALSALVDDPQSTDKDWLVVKHNTDNGNVLQYVSLSSIDVQAQTDSDIIGGRQQSLGVTTIGNEAVLQAFDFNNPTTFALSAQVSATGGTATFMPVRDGLDYSITGAKVLCRTENVDGTTLRYANLKMSVVGMPNLDVLNGLSVVTGIEYPMTGVNQYKIVAHRKQLNIVNNVLTITNLADQTIDTVAHDDIYPNN